MALFPAVWTDFANWSWSTWENPWRGLLKIDKKKKKKKYEPIKVQKFTALHFLTFFISERCNGGRASYSDFSLCE